MEVPATLLLLCGGSGNRMLGTVGDKVLVELRGKPVVQHTLDTLPQLPFFDSLVVATRDEEQRRRIERLLQAIQGLPSTYWTEGGPTRQDSVWNGFAGVPRGPRLVFIHDAARPLVVPDVWHRLYRMALDHDSAILARPVTDTIKEVEQPLSEVHRQQVRTLDRSRLWAVETPQVFSLEAIREAYRSARDAGVVMTDDCSALERLGQPVSFLENPHPNPKITRPADLEWVEFLLQ